MRHRIAHAVLLLAVAASVAACGERAGDRAEASNDVVGTGDPTPAAPAATASSATRTPTGSATVAASHRKPPCDPGGGFPRQRAGCPDPSPETGWVSVGANGVLLLQPFRTYTDDEIGREYAESHDLDYPFSNDYLDAPIGDPRPLLLSRTTVCTGIVEVGHRDPLADHAVDCEEFRHAGVDRVPAAVWRDGGRVVQLSELYRP